MRAKLDSAFSISSISGRADASVQRVSAQRAIIEFYGVSLRLNPLRLLGHFANEAGHDITDLRDDRMARDLARANIIAHTQQVIAGERPEVIGWERGCLELIQACAGSARAMLCYLAFRAIRQLRSTATSDLVRDTLERSIATLRSLYRRIAAQLAAVALPAVQRITTSTQPPPALGHLVRCIGVAGFVALPLLPDGLQRDPPVGSSTAAASAPEHTISVGFSAVVRPPEAKPAAATDLGFTRDNLRYCIFQQVRLEAIGPVTGNTESDAYAALVADWNHRCARFRFERADKDAVDSEVKTRRATLEADGRALVRGWQRQIETALQRIPPAAAPDPGSLVSTASTDPLPPIIVMGRDARSEISWGFNPLIKTPSLVLLRPEAATRVQERLNELGYAVKPVDGSWGPSSRSALRRFKEANGLLWNDSFDIETVTRLFSASASPASPPASPKSDITFETAYPPPPGASLNPLNRTDAQLIQRRLAALGYYGGAGDGLWGVAARRALRAFKVANDLADDDEWDQMTEQVLQEDQATRVSVAAAEAAAVTAPAKAETLPLPMRRPARRAALPMTREEIPRPPAAIPPRGGAAR
jgi:peptidoglycan hydrolase-like protein with peptidoglycan-binding domain